MEDLAKNYDELGVRCINALKSLHEQYPDVWINRLVSLMEGVRELPRCELNGPLDLMLIIDVDRLSQHKNVSKQLLNYFTMLPGYDKVKGASALSHDQHLKTIAILVPIMVSMV